MIVFTGDNARIDQDQVYEWLIENDHDPASVTVEIVVQALNACGYSVNKKS